MDSVSVSVPARLHLGFLDLNGGLGRKFGSLGVALEEPVTRLTLRRAARRAEGPDSARAMRNLERLAAQLGVAGPFRLEIAEAIPTHAGLGSGTQIALAAAAALRRLAGLPLDPRRDAELLERGARSGIGIGAFETGGVILDAGRGGGSAPPPIVARIPFPEDWRILLLIDPGAQGIHGPDERQAFAALPPFPETEAAHLCRLVLMQALPALIERDLAAFGSAVAGIQRRLGDHFAPAQGGRYASRKVGDCMAALEQAGAHGCGQSSWGPTGFAFAESPEESARLLNLAKARPDSAGLDLRIVRGNNRGASIAPPGEER